MFMCPELFVLACATMLALGFLSIREPRCSRCGRADVLWDCVLCREAALVRAVWQVVLLRVARRDGFVAAHVVDRVLLFCGSPCFQRRVLAMSDMLRGPPWTLSPFFQLDQVFDAVLHQMLPVPRPRRPRRVLGWGLPTVWGRPGHRRNDVSFFVLSRHIAGFIVPRHLVRRCSCQPCQLVDVRAWRRCSVCTNAVLLDLCLGFGRSGMVDRSCLPSRDHDDDEQMSSQSRSSWEHW